MLNALAIDNPLVSAMMNGNPVPIYQSNALLAGAAVFDTPSTGLKRHFYDDAPASGEWLEWGFANKIRVRSLSNAASAVNGVKIQESDDPAGASPSTLNQATASAATPYDSGWITKTKKYFRVTYTNAGAAQTSFDFLVETVGQHYADPTV